MLYNHFSFVNKIFSCGQYCGNIIDYAVKYRLSDEERGSLSPSTTSTGEETTNDLMASPYSK